MQNTTVGDRAMKAAFRTGVHNRYRDTLSGPRPELLADKNKNEADKDKNEPETITSGQDSIVEKTLYVKVAVYGSFGKTLTYDDQWHKRKQGSKTFDIWKWTRKKKITGTKCN
ncbi:hypothetical protein Tco_1387439 [Tanacetum coccineum]